MISQNHLSTAMKTVSLYITCLSVLLLPYSVAAEVLDRVVAVVNEDIITLSELEQSGADYFDKVRQNTPESDLEGTMTIAKQKFLDKLIDQRLINQEATKAQVSISDAEFEKAFAKNLKMMNLTQETFLGKLKESGLSEEYYMKNIREQLLRDKLVLYEVRSRIIITEEMITQYYDTEYAKETKGGGYYLQQIGFTWGKSAAVQQSETIEADKVRARKKAEEARQEILDGADFATIAREKSELPSAADGGDLGTFQEDEMPKNMRDAVIPLKAGQLSAIIETPAGYQFFKLISTKEGQITHQAPYQSVKEEIRKKLFEMKFKEEFQNWVSKIKKEAYIKKMLL